MPVRRPDSRTIMWTVAACLLPGLALEAALLSAQGVLVNILTALLVGAVTDHGCLILTNRRTAWQEADLSVLVTALILAAALPPGAIGPVALATFVALALGKHAYGGLGNNIFNPAMVGYAVVLVSFPAALAEWPPAIWPPDLWSADLWSADAWSADQGESILDGLTGATALTAFKYRGASTVADVWTEAQGFGLMGGRGQEWIGLAFLLGGLWLFRSKMAAWRPCVGMIAALTVLGLAFYDNGSSASLGSPLYHLTSGSTLLAACFVATDPVTHPTSHRGQWLFGILVGSLTFCIRAWGNYPDGLAFAILLGNAITPFIDRRLSLRAGTARG